VTIPGGIRVRIALAVAAIVAAALGSAYLVVVPSLERRLVDARLDELQSRAVPLAERLPRSRFEWGDAVDELASAANARVVAFDVISPPPALTVAADSAQAPREVEDSAVALHALESGRVERGRGVSVHGEYGDVAVPVETRAVVLFRTSLEDSLATVALVKRRLLLATGFALVFAVALGLFASGMLAHRLRRLETAAERIAGGRFDVPVVDRGGDEIGQLARAFDRMRIQLSRLDTARKEFVANASHELRTPIFSLGGFLELLTDEDLDEETRRAFLTTMQTQIERLTKLSTDLLDLSRVDAGQLNVEHEVVNLGEVARLLVEEFEHVGEATDHMLVTEGDEEVWCVGDAERIGQIGRALLMNALVHTPAGTRVTVSARTRSGLPQLRVEDTGPGIAPAEQDAIFERFYRAEGRLASGSGLGLAIAKELAQLMDGSVGLESRPGRTVFTLQLPPGDALEPVAAPTEAFSRENAQHL
jgi:signal transduction histidine kinase